MNRVTNEPFDIKPNMFKFRSMTTRDSLSTTPEHSPLKYGNDFNNTLNPFEETTSGSESPLTAMEMFPSTTPPEYVNEYDNRKSSLPSMDGGDLSSVLQDLPECLENVGDGEVADDQRTTVMLRGIPCRYSQNELFDEITPFGYQFNFMYLPHAMQSPGNLGYAFINFVSPVAAAQFIKEFDGYQWIKQPNSKKRVTPVYAIIQGFSKNACFYSRRNGIKAKYRPWIAPDAKFKLEAPENQATFSSGFSFYENEKKQQSAPNSGKKNRKGKKNSS
jgi:hypothetical protein